MEEEKRVETETVTETSETGRHRELEDPAEEKRVIVDEPVTTTERMTETTVEGE